MSAPLRIFPLLVALTLLASGCKKHEVNVFHELQDVQKLVLAEMTVNKVGTISDDGARGIDALVNNLKVGKRIAAYSFQTYLEAYIDLSELHDGDVTVDPARKFVRLTLPPVHTEYLGRDLGVTEEHYRVSGLRSEITASERAALKEKMNKSLKDDIRNNPEYSSMLVKEAQAKARGFFTILLRDWGYDSEITFRD